MSAGSTAPKGERHRAAPRNMLEWSSQEIRRVVSRLWCILFFLVGSGVLGYGQVVSRAEPTFKSGSELVLIPAIVKDSSGTQVNGLRKRDFAVLEDGRQQKITIFEEIVTSPLPTSRAKHNQKEFDNIAAGDQRSSVSAVILLDYPGFRWESFVYLRYRLLNYFSQKTHMDVPTALAAFDGAQLRTLQDFTTDAAKLGAAVEALSWIHDVSPTQSLRETRVPEDLAELKRDATPMDIKLKLPDMEKIDPISGPSFLQEGECTPEMRALRNGVQKLEMIARAYGGFPGRKSLVWMSDRFPYAFHDPTGGHCAQVAEKFSSRLIQVWRIFTDGQIAVYPVSTEGMSLNITPGNISHLAGVNFDMETRGRMRDLAAQTGGRSFYGRNDLEMSYVEAAKDLDGHYYLIGYYRDRTSGTAKQWHNLEVKAARKGVHIEARKGFFTVPTPSDPETQRRYDLAFARSSLVDFTELTFKVRVDSYPTDDASDSMTIRYAVTIMPGAAKIDATDKNHVLLDIAADVYDENGKRILKIDKTLEAHLKPESIAQLEKGGLSFTSAINMKKGVYTLRFFVRDALSGRLGSITTPYTVN